MLLPPIREAFKIAHVSFSSSGGAGEVASELAQAQRMLGYDSTAIFVAEKGVAGEFMRHPVVFFAALIDFKIRSDHKGQLFTLFRNVLTDRGIYSALRNFDVINLHWTPGILSTKAISKILDDKSKVVIWTLHDMRPLTGGCHHAGSCSNFERNCEKCPQVNPNMHNFVTSNFSKHVDLLQKNDRLQIVSPSIWLSMLAKNSKPLGHFRHLVIANPINCEIFHPIEARMQVSTKDIVIGACAVNLSDPKKNIFSVIKLVERFCKTNPDKNIKLLLIGANPPRDLPNFVEVAGEIHKKEELANLYRQMNVFVTLSLEENFPNTLLESQACGVPAICLNRGGMPEIIRDGINGYVVENDTQALEALEKALNTGQAQELSRNSRNVALENFSSQAVAMRYITDAYQLH